MNPRLAGHGLALGVAWGVVALMTGLLIGVLDPRWLVAGLFGAAAVCLVFYDYRFGVVFLTLLLPWSYSLLLPATRGFNVINFVVFASVASLALRRSFHNEPTVPLPKVVWWCYLLPILIAAAVAWPHLPEAMASFAPSRITGEQPYSPRQFLVSILIKPLFFVLYAFLVANTVRDSKKPEYILIAFGLSAVVPALAIIGVILEGGDVMHRSEYLSNLGLHVNEFGMLLALAAGPLLFMCVGGGSVLVRFASGVAFGIVSMGMLLTASRGAAVAFVVIVFTWLFRRRKLTDLIVGVILAAALVLVLPGQVEERLTLGLRDIASTSHTDFRDQLTMGRGAIWSLLAPEIMDSPLWGKGVGSTAWNAANLAGRFGFTHPHSMYLEVLLDLGILGFAAISYLYYRYGRRFSALSREPSLPPVVRDYFAGMLASFVGMLAFALSNGHWMPHPEQTFWWFGLGLTFSYWRLGQRTAGANTPKSFGIDIRRAAARRSVP